MGDREGMSGVANQPLEGISKIVRVTRTPLGVVALAIIAPIAFSVAIFLFSPLPLIVKCVIGGLPLGFVLLVWLQFWAKAKNEPLAASEEYYIAALRYKHLGRMDSRLPEDWDFEKIRNRGLALPEQADPEQSDEEEGESPP